MKINCIICLVAALGLTACANLQEQAKIKKNEATSIALKQSCGVPKKWEIQKKDDQLTWFIDVRNPDTKQVTQVAIDANSGNVINSKVKACKCCD